MTCKFNQKIDGYSLPELFTNGYLQSETGKFFGRALNTNGNAAFRLVPLYRGQIASSAISPMYQPVTNRGY